MLAGPDFERRGTALWCLGLPRVEERRLDWEEQDCLKRAAWRLLWQGLGSFVGLAVIGVLLMVLAAALGGAWDATLFIIVIVFASLIVFLPATLFAREGWMQRAILLFRDVRRGYVTVFEGLLTEADRLQTEDATDAAQGRLLALGLLTLYGTQNQTVEVLPVSGRVWRVNSQRVGPWVEACYKEVAVSGEETVSWPHASGPMASERGTGRRRLTHREQSELFKEARQHWLRPFVAALLFSAWSSVILIFGLTKVVSAGHVVRSSIPWSSVHLLLITFAADAFFVRRWAQARKMYQDARGGEVLVSLGGAPDDGRMLAAVFESLPNSKRVWTEAGRPAAWRRIGQ